MVESMSPAYKASVRVAGYRPQPHNAYAFG